MRTPFVAGNWKMYKTVAEARHLISELVPGLQSIAGVQKVICPPFTDLLAAAALLEGTDIGLGAQNLFWEPSGAYTGEISPLMLAELCQYVIIGHSERRQYFGETDETVNRKVQAALSHGLTPIVCVGETLEEYEANVTADVVSRQIHEGLAGLSLGEDQVNMPLIIAYEPVWAIGTGRAATADGANAVVADIIRTALADLFGDEAAQAIRVLYGGSVKPENAREFFQQPDIDGALVGGASLKADQFIAIVQAAVP
ncbi:MAG: triose-phosphate isomerase [Chloroflexi bacterium]|jgi:triosephosphate isomerase|nr:triose-phosphate isomerase [Chloroflexota bacterium]